MVDTGGTAGLSAGKALFAAGDRKGSRSEESMDQENSEEHIQKIEEQIIAGEIMNLSIKLL